MVYAVLKIVIYIHNNTYMRMCQVNKYNVSAMKTGTHKHERVAVVSHFDVHKWSMRVNEWVIGCGDDGYIRLAVTVEINAKLRAYKFALLTL